MLASDSLELLLREVRNDAVVPERYSRRSFYGRCEPLMLTSLLAAIAILGGMLVCEMTRQPTSQHPER